MDYGALAKKELSDDASYERGLFIKEILVLGFMVMGVFLRECVWQECVISHDSEYEAQVEKKLNENKNIAFYELVKENHRLFHELIKKLITELQQTNLPPYKNAAFLFAWSFILNVPQPEAAAQDDTELPEGLNSAYYALVRAIEAREKKDFGTAEALIKLYMKHYPRDLDGYFEAAIIHEWQEKLDEALVFYEIILERKPKHINALIGKARVTRWQGGVEEARLLYAQILKLRPNAPDALSGLGMCELMEDNREAAFRYFKRVINIFPNHAEALIGIQMAGYTPDGQLIELYKNDDVDAIDHEAVPDFLSPYLAEAEEARQEKDFIAAEKAIQRFLKLYPDNILGFFEYAIILEWQGKLKEAAVYYDKIISQDVEHIGALLGQARLLRWQGYIKESKRKYEFILKLDKGNLDALTGLGMCALVQKNRSLAFSYFAKVLDENPHHEEALQGHKMADQLIIGQISAYLQWQTNNLSEGRQSLTGINFWHQMNAYWRIGGHVASSESQFMVVEDPADTSNDKLKRIYELNSSIKPSNSHFWLVSVQRDEYTQSTTDSFQVNTGIEILEDQMLEVSARWFLNDKGLKNTLYSMSYTLPIEHSSWRVTGQVFYNKSEIGTIKDNHSLVAQGLWEPDDDRLFRASVSTSYYLNDHHYGLSVSWKDFWGHHWGYEIGSGYHDNHDQLDIKSSLLFRY